MELSVAIERPRIDNVKLVKADLFWKPGSGSLAFTGHHLIFQPSDGDDSPNKEMSVGCFVFGWYFFNSWVVSFFIKLSSKGGSGSKKEIEKQ